MSDNWIAKTVAAKSDQLNAEDLIAGPITVTVLDVRKTGNAEQPVEIEIPERQPYKPCKTMRRLLIALWGEVAAEWIGRRLTLWADPSVKYGGVAMGGIRISHMSDIAQTHTVMLTETRGKKKPVTIEPLKAPAEKTVAERVDACVQAHNECQTLKRLKQLSKRVDDLVEECDDEQKRRVKEACDSAVERVNAKADKETP